jgi:hypothetical protein
MKSLRTLHFQLRTEGKAIFMFTSKNAKRGDMAEAAVTLPVILLVTMFMINVSLAAYTANVAATAAAYGAKVGATTQGNAAISQSSAQAATNHLLNAAGVRGSWGVQVNAGNGRPGGSVAVVVSWSFPSYLSGLCALFGVSCPANFSGDAVAAYRKEGW